MQSHMGEDVFHSFNDSEASSLMPPTEDLHREFEDALKNMDLPPEKMRMLRSYDLKKKWDLVRDQRRQNMKSVTDPGVYLSKLSVYLDKKQLKKKKKLLGGESSTAILKHLEISLRTNSIDWVREFLEKYNGLQVLIDYLSQLQETHADLYAAENVPSTSSSTSSYFTALTSPYCSPNNGDLSSFSNGGLSSSPINSSSQFYYDSVRAAGSTNGGRFGTYSSSAVTAMPNNGSSLLLSGSSIGAVSRSASLFRGNSGVSVNAVTATNATDNGKKALSKMSTVDGTVLEDDMHVCVLCLHAILNTAIGFNQVLNSRRAIYCIVRSICHHSMRTKTLAVAMLSTMCFLSDGSELILDAFNGFRLNYREYRRFQTLFSYLVDPNAFHIDFMHACINFFNVVVHRTEDFAKRIALQHEMSCLGLDKFLDDLSQRDIDDALRQQAYTYLNNVIDVDKLVDNSDKCISVIEQNGVLEQELSALRERLQEVEADYIARNALLSKRLTDLVAEKDCLEKEKLTKDQALNTLTRDLREREQKYESEKTQLESRIQELERTQREFQEGLKIAQRNSAQAAKAAVSGGSSPPTTKPSPISVSTKASVPLAPPPPPPGLLGATKKAPPAGGLPPSPPPPPPASLFGKSAAVAGKGGQPGPPPPPPPFLGAAMMKPIVNAEPVTIKKVAKTKHKLPLFNWSALSSNQVKGTVFNDLDDEKLIEVLDLSFLEDMFKIGNVPADEMMSSTSTIATTNSAEQAAIATQVSPGSSAASASASNVGKTSLLGTKRLQNIAITRRKLAKPVTEIMSAVHRFDLSVLPQENVDILLPIVPTADEVQQYRDYAAKNGGSFDGLTPEDQFLAQLMKIERLTHKLNIMSFMAGFDESYNLLVPQVQKVTAASKSIRGATSFHKIIEVILAVGNAMNGNRRTPIYGFKLTSLDSLVILKSPRDRSVTMMHVIAELVTSKFPDLLNVTDQLKFAESAAGVNIETINADMREIETKYSRARSEQERKGGSESCPAVLNEFLEAVSPKLALLRENLKLAQEAFTECAEYYGEMTRNLQADAFFTRIASFVKHFEQALTENESRRAAEQRQAADEERRELRQRRRREVENPKMQLMDELTAKIRKSSAEDGSSGGPPTLAKKGAKHDTGQINDGDFERIMNGLKDGFVAFDSPVSITGGRRCAGKSSSPSPHRPGRSQAAGPAGADGNFLGVAHLVQRDRTH